MDLGTFIKTLLLQQYNKSSILNTAFHYFDTKHPLLLHPDSKKTLGLGSKFIPRPPDIPDRTLDIEATAFTRRLRIRRFFDNRPDITTAYNSRLRIAGDTVTHRWEPPFEAKDNIYRIGSHFYQRLNELKSEHPPKKRQKSSHLITIEKLQQLDEVVFTETDKNLGLAALSLSFYNKLAQDMLDDENTYLELRDIDKNVFLSDMTNIERFFIKEISSEIPEENQRKFLQNFSQARKIPLFHILPKIHKKPLSARPIVGATNWITTRASIVLNVRLEETVKAIPEVLKDSNDMREHLDKIFKVPRNWFLVSFDVIALYPNIPQTELIHILFGEDNSRVMGKLGEFILTNTYMEYAEKIYKQKEGMPMGTNAAVHLANLFLSRTTDKFFLNHPNIFHFRRYIDDLFFLWDGSEEDLQTLLQTANNLHRTIKFTIQFDKNKLPFLDILISKNDYGILNYEIYQKPMNRFLYIPPTSCHPPHIFRSFIRGELQRYARLTSTQFKYARTKEKFFLRLSLRGYSHKWLREIFNSHSWIDRYKPYRKRTENINTFKCVYSKRRISKKLAKLVAYYSRFTSARCLIAWKKAPNIRDYLVRSSLSARQVALLRHDARYQQNC